jgi:hypothetical protein
MAYAQFGLIQATDFNTLVGGNPTATANTLNATWATGSGTAGYGQTAVANVAAANTVLATSWNALVSNTASAASHQGSTITGVTAPVAGTTVTFLSAVPTNLQTIYTNRLNAGTQSGTTANTATRGTTWSTALTFTHTATFANGDAARFFFNSGGQLKMTVSHANNAAGINLLFNNLASNVGTVALSAPSSGTASIAGTTFNGITKVGGGGNAPTISQNNGYYALTTSNANVFTQTASTGPSGYLSSFIRFIVKSNGTVGSNGDVGNVVTIFTVWDEVPDGLTVGSGSATTLTVVPPETTNIANTWGTITLAGSVTGS